MHIVLHMMFNTSSNYIFLLLQLMLLTRYICCCEMYGCCSISTSKVERSHLWVTVWRMLSTAQIAHIFLDALKSIAMNQLFISIGMSKTFSFHCDKILCAQHIDFKRNFTRFFSISHFYFFVGVRQFWFFEN